MAKRIKYLRTLSNPNTKFEWTDGLNKLFEESKDVITLEIEGVRILLQEEYVKLTYLHPMK